jgi:hypothetical protein
MLRCINNGVMTIKPGQKTTGNAHMTWSDESSFTLFPTSERVNVCITPKEVYNPECLVPTMKNGEGSVTVSVAILKYRVGPIITYHAQITAREYVNRFGNQVHLMIQTLFPKNDVFFPR